MATVSEVKDELVGVFAKENASAAKISECKFFEDCDRIGAFLSNKQAVMEALRRSAHS